MDQLSNELQDKVCLISGSSRDLGRALAVEFARRGASLVINSRQGSLKELAETERLPASQLVSLALARFLQDLSTSQVDLAPFKQPSRSPRYDWNLILPEELVPVEVRKGGRKVKRGA